MTERVLFCPAAVVIIVSAVLTGFFIVVDIPDATPVEVSVARDLEVVSVGQINRAEILRFEDPERGVTCYMPRHDSRSLSCARTALATAEPPKRRHAKREIRTGSAQ